MTKVYIVWLNYPNEPPRLLAIFKSHDEAKRYADRDDGEGSRGGFTTIVTTEPVYKSADDV